jgi:hypothetical protein
MYALCRIKQKLMPAIATEALFCVECQKHVFTTTAGPIDSYANEQHTGCRCNSACIDVSGADANLLCDCQGKGTQHLYTTCVHRT